MKYPVEFPTGSFRGMLLNLLLFHRVLKDLQSWKEAPLDSMILSLYQLQAFYFNEINRGIAGLGEYSIASSYSHIEVQTLAHLSTYSPEEIVIRQYSFDNKLHCFTVKGTSGVLRVVTLFPKENCSCPSTGECYHLMAVRLSIGMTEVKEVSHHAI